MIFSASRRTDIPAFYGDWFMARLRAGDIAVRNPMNPKQVSRFLFDAAAIDCIVFWTKDARPFFPYIDELDRLGYRYYFQWTITPYHDDIEAHIEKSRLLESFIQLAERIGREKVIWRYDPIIITERYTLDFHLEQFARMAEKLHPWTEKCVISFVDRYSFLKTEFKTLGIEELDHTMIDHLASGLSRIAASYSPVLKLASCSEKADLSAYGITHNSCIDSALVEAITGHAVPQRKDPSQRPECRCAASRDIGTYNTCRHGCVYCYARRGPAAPEKADPASPLLCGQIGAEDVVKTVDLREL
jgi:hypothetical protein